MKILVKQIVGTSIPSPGVDPRHRRFCAVERRKASKSRDFGEAIDLACRDAHAEGGRPYIYHYYVVDDVSVNYLLRLLFVSEVKAVWIAVLVFWGQLIGLNPFAHGELLTAIAIL